MAPDFYQIGADDLDELEAIGEQVYMASLHLRESTVASFQARTQVVFHRIKNLTYRIRGQMQDQS